MDVTQMFHVVSNRLMACVWARQTNRAIENGRKNISINPCGFFFGINSFKHFPCPFIFYTKKVECLCIFCVSWQVFLEPHFTGSIHFGSCKKTREFPLPSRSRFTSVMKPSSIRASLLVARMAGRCVEKMMGRWDLGISWNFWVVATQIFLEFSPRTLGKISNLTNIFKWVETTNLDFHRKNETQRVPASIWCGTRCFRCLIFHGISCYHWSLSSSSQRRQAPPFLSCSLINYSRLSLSLSWHLRSPWKWGDFSFCGAGKRGWRWKPIASWRMIFDVDGEYAAMRFSSWIPTWLFGDVWKKEVQRNHLGQSCGVQFNAIIIKLDYERTSLHFEWLDCLDCSLSIAPWEQR